MKKSITFWRIYLHTYTYIHRPYYAHIYLHKYKKSREFTVSRSFMKLFKTGSATVVSECQNSSDFYPSLIKLISELQIFWKNLYPVTTLYLYLSAICHAIQFQS